MVGTPCNRLDYGKVGAADGRKNEAPKPRLEGPIKPCLACYRCRHGCLLRGLEAPALSFGAIARHMSHSALTVN
jgi:hypothetical protein